MEPIETEFNLDAFEKEVEELESELEPELQTSREKHQEVEKLLKEIHQQLEFLRELSEKD